MTDLDSIRQRLNEPCFCDVCVGESEGLCSTEGRIRDDARALLAEVELLTEHYEERLTLLREERDDYLAEVERLRATQTATYVTAIEREIERLKRRVGDLEMADIDQ